MAVPPAQRPRVEPSTLTSSPPAAMLPAVAKTLAGGGKKNGLIH